MAKKMGMPSNVKNGGQKVPAQGTKGLVSGPATMYKRGK